MQSNLSFSYKEEHKVRDIFRHKISRSKTTKVRKAKYKIMIVKSKILEETQDICYFVVITSKKYYENRIFSFNSTDILWLRDSLKWISYISLTNWEPSINTIKYNELCDWCDRGEYLNIWTLSEDVFDNLIYFLSQHSRLVKKQIKEVSGDSVLDWVVTDVVEKLWL